MGRERLGASAANAVAAASDEDVFTSEHGAIDHVDYADCCACTIKR